MEQAKHLNTLGKDLKEALIDRRREFEKGAAGDKFSHQQQLAQFMIQQNMDEQDFMDYQQEVQTSLESDIANMNNAYRILEAEEQRMLKSGEAALDRESLAKIQKHKRILAEEAKKAKKKAATFGKIMDAAKFAVTVGVAAGSVATGVGAGAGLLVASELIEQGV